MLNFITNVDELPVNKKRCSTPFHIYDKRSKLQQDTISNPSKWQTSETVGNTLGETDPHTLLGGSEMQRYLAIANRTIGTFTL